MLDRYRHKEECYIVLVKGDEGVQNRMVVFDRDGELVFSVPEAWTDEQIWRALDLQNEAYAVGIRVGRALKLREIRDALEIKGY